MILILTDSYDAFLLRSWIQTRSPMDFCLNGVETILRKLACRKALKFQKHVCQVMYLYVLAYTREDVVNKRHAMRHTERGY